jgi:hypothetical protein
MATATQPATIKAVEQPDDDRQMLRLDAEAAQIVVDSLLIEWETPGKGSCAGGERGLRLDRREMHATAAAWKARRQTVILDMLEQLGVVAG